MTVDTDEPFVLDEDFEAARAILVNLHDSAVLIAHTSKTTGARECEAEMKCAGFRMTSKDARPERR